MIKKKRFYLSILFDHTSINIIIFNYLSNLFQLVVGDRILCLNMYHLIRLSGKFVQLISKRISETFGFCHSIEGELLLRYTTQSDKIYKITRFYAFKCAVSTISKTFFLKTASSKTKMPVNFFFSKKKTFLKS